MSDEGMGRVIFLLYVVIPCSIMYGLGILTGWMIWS